MKNILRKITVVVTAVAFYLSGTAQVANYSFAQSNGTYTPITGGTVHSSAIGTGMDDAVFLVTLPFSFTFNGTAYTQAYLSENGYLSFGSTSPGTTTRLALSTTSTGQIAAPFCKDLSANTVTAGELRSQTLGSGTARTFVVQWTNMASYSTAGQSFTFQLRLNEAGGTAANQTLDFVYGTCSSTAAATGQVGLRGTATTDYKNRTISSSTGYSSSSFNWSNTAAGTANSQTVIFNSTTTPVTLPTSGLTFTYTPGVACSGTPANGGTPVLANISNCPTATPSTTIAYVNGETNGSGITYQWQSSTSSATGPWANATGTGNATVQYTFGSLTSATWFQLLTKCGASTKASSPIYVGPVAPTTQTSAIAGANGTACPNMNLSWTNGSGTGRVVYVNTTNSFTDPTTGALPTANLTYTSGQQCVYAGSAASVSAITGLTAGQTYYFKAYEYFTCGASSYFNVTSGTNASSFTIVSASAPSTQVTNIAGANGSTCPNLNITWTNGSGTGRIVYVNTTNTFTNPSGALPTANLAYTSGQQCVYVGSAASVSAITGLTAGQTYYFKAYEYFTCGATTYYNTTTGTNAGSFVVSDVPSVQASNVTFSAIGSAGATISWTNGTGGTNRLVYVNTTNSFTAPTSTPGSANTVYASGQQLVYSGTASTVSITGLSAGTQYFVRVYESKLCVTSYINNTTTSTNNPNNFTTIAALNYTIARTSNPRTDYRPLSSPNILLGTATWDDQTAAIPTAQFASGVFDNFYYQGQKITAITVGANGHIAMNASTNGAYSNNIGTSGTNALICPYYEDLYNTTGTNATVSWKLLTGSGGNDTMVVEWANAEFYNFTGANVNFQVKLIEGTNQIIFDYGIMQVLDGTNSGANSNGYGSSYSVGLKGFSVSATPVQGEVFAQLVENSTTFGFWGTNVTNKGANKLISPPDCFSSLIFTPGTYSYTTPGLPPIPSNDNPSSATTIVPFLSTPSDFCGTFYTTFRATSSGVAARANVSTTVPDDDVWFTFVANSTSTNLVARSGGGFDAVIELFDGSAYPTLTSLAAVNAVTSSGANPNTETLSYPTSVGTTYYARVYNSGGGTQATATATVTSGAITAITMGTTGAGYYSCYGGNANTDYPTVLISDPTGRGAVLDPTAVTATPGAMTSIAIQAGGSGYTSPTVFIAPPGSGPTGQFSLIILATPTPPANDTLDKAVALTPGNTCSFTSGSTLNATPSANKPATTCGNADDDVWYKFVPNNSGQVQIQVQGSAGFNPSFQVFDAGLTSANDTTFATLTAGNKGCVTGVGNGTIDSATIAGLLNTHTYYIRVYHNGAGSGSSSFSICVKNLPATCPIVSAPTNPNGIVYTGVGATLAWSVGGGSQTYDVYLSQTRSDITGLNVAKKIGSALTVRTLSTGALAAGTWYWTVVGINGLGSSSGCQVDTFTASSDLLMPEGNKSITYTTCGDTIYDNGGKNGVYKELTRDTAVICPSTAGKKVKITITAFDIDPDDSYSYYYDDDWGDLQVFNGSGVVQANNFAGSGNYYDNNTPPPTTFTSTSADGCLTLRTTNYYNTYNYDGFAAAISCETPCFGTPATPVAKGDTAYCGSGTGRRVSISGFSTTAGITHQWYRSNDGTNYSPINQTDTALIANNITATRWYKCLDSCTFSNQKVFSNVVVLTVNPLPTAAVSASAVYVCPSASATLTATGGSTYAWSAGTTPSTGASVSVSPSATTVYTVTATSAVGCKASDSIRVRLAALPVASITANPTTSVCKNDTVTLQVPTTSFTIANKLGSATTTTSTTGITPYSSNYEGSREQYLVRASELTALGYRPGKITSLAFNVTSQGSGTDPQVNFTIKMGHTATAAFSGAFLTPTGVYTTVFTNASESAPAVGLKTYTFSTPFVWDGTNNILLDICHDNDISASCLSCYSSNSTVAASTTTYNSVYGRYNDDAAACGVNASTAISTFTTRPDMTFTQDFRDTVRWTPAATLFRNALASLAYTNQDTNIVYAKTLVTQVYTATVTSVIGCKSQPTKTVTVINCANVWNGNTSNSWNTNTNWSLGLVPNACSDDVQIPDVTGLGKPQPLITSNVTVGNMYIDSKSSITISGGSKLSVCKDWIQMGGGGTQVSGGDVVMNGSVGQTISGGNPYVSSAATFDKLIINNSSAGVTNTGHIRLNTGLILQDGDFTNNNIVTLKSSATGTAYLDNFTYPSTAGTYVGAITSERYNSGTGNGGYSASDFHYIASGVTTTFADWNNIHGNVVSNGTGAIKPLPTCDPNNIDWTSPYGALMEWHENGPFPTNCSQEGWYVLGQTAPFLNATITKGRGYSAYLKPGQTVSVTGNPNTGNIPVTLTNSGLTPNNPTGPVATSGQNLIGNPYPSPYQWDRLGNSSNIGAIAYAWQATSGYAGTYQNITVGSNIAVAQGFMVLASSGGAYNFQQNKRQAVLNPTFYKNQNGASLIVEVSGNNFRDKTEVAFNDQSTTNFDFDYDGYKMMSKPAQPTLYTGLSTNKMLSLNTQPSIAQAPTVPMGMYVGTNGNFTFTFDNIASFDPTTYIYLEDKQTATMQDMRANNSYSFVGNTADATDRFVIHFTPPMDVTTTDASCTTTGTIKLEQPGTASWTYTLKDNGNNTISTGTINSNTPASIAASNGIYTLELVDAAGYNVSQSIQVNGVASIAAAFNSSASSVRTNEAINFNNTTSGASTYSWDFGDGSNAITTATAAHSYAAAGTYTVTLTVTNAAGCQSSVTRSVTVSNATGITEATASSMNIFSFDDKVVVDFSKMKNVEATIQIYNLIGQELSSEKHVGSSVYTKELNEIDAAYVLVRVRSSNGQLVTKKVFISNSK